MRIVAPICIIKKSCIRETNMGPLHSIIFLKDSQYLKSLNVGLREVGTRRCLNRVNKRKKTVKTFFAAGILDHFWTKMFVSETTSWHYFSPRIQNIGKVWKLDFGKWGAKRRLNGVNKWKRKTLFGAALFNHLWAKMYKSETTFFILFYQRIPNL